MAEVYTEFVRDILPFQAVKVTKKNLASVALWCGGTVVKEDVPSKPDAKKKVYIRLERYHYEAGIGDWVFHDPNPGEGENRRGPWWTVYNDEQMKRYKEKN